MKALLVIDIQKDYFPGGKFPLEGAEEALQQALTAIERAKREGTKVVAIQHVAPAGAPFFEEGSEGARLHPRIEDAVRGEALVTKHEADSFLGTNLESVLQEAGADDLEIVGMMTQHCVTHTSLSPGAYGKKVKIYGDACAAPTRALSALALSGLKARFQVE
jgi:nicotinamidase-related amidase